MSEPVLSRKRQGAQDAVDTLETFEAFEAFDKHGLPAFSAAWMLKRSIFFLALFRTGTLPRAAEQLGISLSSANRMLAKLRTYWDDPLFVRSGFLMQPTTAAKRRYDKVLSLMHVLEDLLDLVFFARQGLHPDIHSAAPSPRRTSVWCGADTLSLNVLQLWGPLNAKILKPSRRCSSMPSPTDRYRAPNSPGNGWFNPKNPDRIALVTPFFLAASLCLEETDCYAIVPKATAELALDPRRTAMLALSDAAPKLTVRLGWHERTHADPGSQLIRAQLLALIQKRFGLPAGE